MRYKCNLCGHEWMSRLEDGKKPVECPKCKRHDWDEPKKKKLKKVIES